MNAPVSDSKSNDLRNQIKFHLSELDIAGYLYEEVCYMLDHLNYYKLLNIHTNQDTFFSYLCSVDDENTKLIHSLLRN